MTGLREPASRAPSPRNAGERAGVRGLLSHDGCAHPAQRLMAPLPGPLPGVAGRGRFWKQAVLLALTLAFAAHAQEPADAGVPAPDAGAAEPSLADLLGEAAATLVSPTKPTTPSSNPVVRAFQSLNPDLSVILDGTVGFSERAPLRLAGDDPNLGGDATNRAAGATLQEAEVGISAVVDPYLKGELYLTIPNLKGLEVEEAIVSTTSLPWNLQLRGGVFRSAFGRQNGQHLHVQDFTRRPLLNASYLGDDGLRSPGVQVSWLVPVDFFLQLTVEGFSVAPPDDLTQLTTFGGGKRTDFTYTAELKTFAPLGDSLSVSAGLSAATGLTAGTLDRPELANARSWLYGADLYVKFKPPNQVAGYFSLAWQSEFVLRKVSADLLDGGLYSQLVAQVARRWFVGVREDVLGLPASSLQPLRSRTGASLTFAPTEFSRVRAYVEREFAHASDVHDSWGAYLQVEISLGAHGAHAF